MKINEEIRLKDMFHTEYHLKRVFLGYIPEKVFIRGNWGFEGKIKGRP